ncbi:fimbria/pilus periplasmic chaperone [Pantoea ananatis]|uniref:fimbria/pilus periplasmic chaperone n=1 Tax=Pantoea ananas TaxID=553 RepID=UPI003FA408A9
MSKFLHYIVFFIFTGIIFPKNAGADGGITIQGTRLIYPMGEKQLTFSIYNTSSKDSFLVQSWTEDQHGKKSKDFIVVPPLYLSGPKDENLLRIILMNKALPKNKESLYYFVAKGIPPIHSNKEKNNNTVLIALASRIKLIVRPDGLLPKPDDVPSKIYFSRENNDINLYNPTPYYVTTVNITYGNTKLPSIMVEPFSKKKLPCNIKSTSDISFATINDYGSITPTKTVKISNN